MHKKAEIELSVKAGDSHIKIDGAEIEGVTKVVVSQVAGEVPHITLDLLMDSFHIAAEGELHLPPGQRDLWADPIKKSDVERADWGLPTITSGPGHVFHRPRGWNPYDGCHE